MFGLRYLPGVATLTLDVAKCNGCRMCVAVCPHAVFAIVEKRASIVDLDGCMECGACALNCPEQALAVHAGVGCAAAILVSGADDPNPGCDCACCPD